MKIYIETIEVGTGLAVGILTAFQIKKLFKKQRELAQSVCAECIHGIHDADETELEEDFE